MLRRLVTIFVVSSISLSVEAATDTAPSGFFISIDGVNPAYVDALTGSGDLAAEHGLGWLSQNSARSNQARAIETTLTAASHVSIVTCTPPSRHGIVANGFYVGDEIVSGFSHPFATEPMWRAVARQGKTVLSLAYAGADGLAPERFADFGIAYPVAKYVSRRQTLEKPISELEAATGWEAAFPLTGAYQLEFELVINPVSAETRTLQVLVLRSAQGTKAYIDSDKNLRNGYRTELTATTIGHMYFTETDKTSPLVGYKRTAFATLLPSADDQFKMYVSGSSYNNAYPASLRAQLDAAHLVWPEYGIKVDDISVEQYIAGQSLIDTFLTDVATVALPLVNPDVVLFYQPLIDTVGHKYEGLLPTPFNPEADDVVTRTYKAAYSVVDRNLDRLYGAYRNSAVINLMGDHGMDPIKKIVNLAALLPENVRLGVKSQTSGALVMLYDSQLSPTFNAGEILRERLATLRYEGSLVGGDSRDRGDYVQGRSQDFSDEWQYGEADWAFLAGPGFWFEYSPNESEVFEEPPIYGMHGHRPSLPSMTTAYYLRTPDTRAQDIGPIDLIDAVPTFLARLGLQPPRDCLGSARNWD